MRIVLFSLGIGFYGVQLAKGLAEKHQVNCVLNDREVVSLIREYPRFFENQNFEIIPVPHRSIKDPRKFMATWQGYHAVKRNTAEVVHAQLNGIWLETYLTYCLTRRAGIPLVGTVHDTRFHPGDTAPLRMIKMHFKTLAKCAQLIVHGETLAADLIDNFGVDQRVVNVVEHGNFDVFMSALSQPPPPRIPGRVVLFGRMKEYKGVDVLVEAARIASKTLPNLEVVLAGRGEALDRLKPALAGDPLFDVRSRYIPAEEVADIYSSSSLVVLPYLEASQSGPLNIAFSFGKPVVASRVGAMPEVVSHGVEGLLTTPGDPHELAAAMVTILQNPALGQEMGAAGRKKAAGLLNWSGAIREKTLKVYEKAIRMQRDKVQYPGVGPHRRWALVQDYLDRMHHEGR